MKFLPPFFCLCFALFNLLALPLFANETQENIDFSQNENSQLYSLQKVAREKDLEKMYNILETISNDYSYFTPRVQNLNLRKAPSIEGDKFTNKLQIYSEKKAKSDEIIWSGGIISNKEIAGNNQCPSWRELVLIEFSREGLVQLALPYEESDKRNQNTPLAYVCANLVSIKTLEEKQINEMQEILLNVHDNASLMLQEDSLTSAYTFLYLDEAIAIYDNSGAIIHTTKPNSLIALSKPDFDYPKNEVWVLGIINHKSHTLLGKIPFDTVESLPISDEGSKTALKAYLDTYSD